MALFKKRTVGSSTKRKKNDGLSDKSDDEDDDENVVVKKTKEAKASSATNNAEGPKVTRFTQVKYDHSHAKEIKNESNEQATQEDRLIRDAQQLDKMAQEEQERINQEKKTTEGQNIYRGKSNYSKFVNDTSHKKIGPAKSSANVRTTTITDFQPDVCKDYKLTGYCGYGESCKFLHAREDYAAGWKLDQEWEKDKKQHQQPGEDKKLVIEEQQIPFKCPICKDDYKSPVVTKCEHYFCEECFLNEYRRKKGCFICGKDTAGIAKPAKNLKELLNV